MALWPPRGEIKTGRREQESNKGEKERETKKSEKKERKKKDEKKEVKRAKVAINASQIREEKNFRLFFAFATWPI